MASRGLTSAIIAALGSSHSETYHLVRMDFSTPLYYTNAPYDITYDGNVYLSNALISEIPDVPESLDIKPSSISLTFGGAALSTHSLMLGNYTGVDVYVYNYSVSAVDAYLKWQGIVESASSREDLKKGTSTVTWRVTNHWVNWEAKNGRLLTDQYQQKLHPGDLGLQFVDKTKTVVDWWGQRTAFNYFVDELYLQDSFSGSISEEASTRSLPVLYGESIVKGIPVFRTITGSYNEYLQVVYAISEGECDSLVDVTFFDEDISYTDGTISPYIDLAFHSGTTTQTVDTSLFNNSPDWTTYHELKGICYVRVTYTYNDVWMSGEPVPKFKVRGKKLYDPRDTLTAYSTNPALVLYDYITNSIYGKNISPDLLGDIIDGANYCDTQHYDHSNAATQSLIAKFAFNGVIDTSKTIRKNVETILFTMLGSLPWASGIYHLVIERDDDSSIYSFNEDNIKDVFEVEYEGKDNVVQYVFIDPLLDYTEATITIDDASYLAEDNNLEFKKEYSNKYETNRYRATNRGTTMLKKSRQNLAVKLVCADANANQLMPGNVVDITRASQGWSGKLFRIEDMTIANDGDVSITRLSEYEPSVYDWAIGTEYTPPADTNLINPFLTSPPSNLVVESGTNHLLQLADGTVVTRAYITWTAPTDIPISGYEIDYKKFIDTNYIRVSISDPTTEEAYVTPVEDGMTYDIRMRSINELGLASSWIQGQHLIIGKTAPPSNVSLFNYGFQDYSILLSWSAVSDADVFTYEIRTGTVWDDGVFVARVDGTRHLSAMASVGSHDFMIKAVDTSGNYSVDHSSVAVVITAPSQPVVDLSYAGGDLILEWTASNGSFPISEYEIRYGDVFATSTLVANTSGNTFDIPVDYGGTTKFWVVAIDAAGNESSPGSNDSVIVAPSQPTVTAEVIDNNVLLRWTTSTGTLPVAHYEVRKGAVFSTATVLQSINGTFAMFFENEAGTYTYWVVPVDTAGNYGTEQSVAPIVNSPPDYILNINWLSDFSGTKTNCFISSANTLIVGVNTTETYEEHFVNNSWDQPSDQIAAGFEYFIQPSSTSGVYEETFDYGAVLAGTMITVIANSLLIDGAVTSAITISTKELIGDPWDDNVGVSQIYATNFRYVKIKIDYTSSGGDDLFEVLSLNVKLDSKVINDGGSGTAVSTDSGGTFVAFNRPFVDIANIAVTPNSTTPIFAAYDFTDVPNPTGFYVFLYNSAGTRVSGDFSWSARGF